MDIILNEEQQEVVARQVKRLRRHRMAARRRRIAKARKRTACLMVCCSIILSLVVYAGFVEVSEAATFDNNDSQPVVTASVAVPTAVTQEPHAKPELQSFAVPAVQTDFKTFMDYRTITSKSSVQWQMQQEAETNDEGFRIWNGYYMVAMGTYYAPYCGRIFSITLSSGRVFQCVVADIKADKDTDANNQHRNGNVIEFIVDGDHIPDICWKMGDMSWAPEADMRGDVEKIELVYSPY